MNNALMECLLMLECIDYHRLSWAAEITGCTKKSLIQLAINDHLDIYTELPNGFKALRINNDGLIVDIKEKKVTGSRMVKIPTSALSEYLVNNHACISVFKSYDEPDIFYQSNDQLRIDKHFLVVMKDDLNRLSESFAAQRAIIDPSIDVPKRADLIDLVSLSKVIARRYNMTNGEACDWVTDQIKPENVLYDISGFALPKRIHELKTERAPSECFNQYWWEHPKKESEPIHSLDGISANGIAISKADAEKFCLIPSSELDDLAIEKVPLNADALNVTIRASVIDLISLSKLIAKHMNMTNIDACEWVTGDIIRKQLLVYSLRSIALPRLIEPKDGMIISALCYELWAEYPDTDGIEIDRFDMNVNQVAISKIDAEKYFSIPISKLEKLVKEKPPLDADTFKEVTRADLIDLVSLSKAVAKHRNMTNGEACDWVTTKISPVEAFYNISGFTLPEQLTESKANHAACDCFNQNWWREPEKEDTPIPGYNGISAKEIAISKADAEKFCLISSSALDEAPKGPHRLFIDSEDVASETIQETETIDAKHQNSISKKLATLNQAFSKFWLNADPNERETHPTNGEVSGWLKLQGCSGASAKQGAVIIRPEWAAKGRR
jgi:hypothetical protein